MEKEDNQQERSKRGRTRPPQSVEGLSEQGAGDVGVMFIPTKEFGRSVNQYII